MKRIKITILTTSLFNYLLKIESAVKQVVLDTIKVVNSGVNKASLNKGIAKTAIMLAVREEK